MDSIRMLTRRRERFFTHTPQARWIFLLVAALAAERAGGRLAAALYSLCCGPRGGGEGDIGSGAFALFCSYPMCVWRVIVVDFS
jgi:hypothetical protein